MTDGSSGSSGRAGSHGGASSSGNVPRRMSYASVASGATPQSSSNSLRAGALAHMATTTSNITYPAGSTNDSQNPRRYSQEQDALGNPKRQSQLPSYSRKYAGLVGAESRLGHHNFFVPSYLKDSRYVAKLEALNTERLRSEKESRSSLLSGLSSVNHSSSRVNVHRIAPSHRGMTYEVIESNPPKDEDQLLPLPTRWNALDKYPGLDVFNDGLDVRYNGSASKSDVEAASVRADYPMSPACGIFYYEVEIKSKSKECAVAIGFSNAKASLERLPGWEPDSWAYHGDDGKTFSGEHNGKPYNHTFAAGDVVGCGVNFHTGQAFFTKNGQDLGVAFREIKNMKPFPCVGIKKYSGAVVSVNFGQRPFVFDINEKVVQEKSTVEHQIKRTKTNFLHPKLDETSLVQEIVAQFLMHGGYVETSKAFEEEVKREKRSLNNTTTTSTSYSQSEIEDTHAASRQQIRRAILAGNIDLALDITNDHYPDVLQRSPEIVFHLKCRKWIELISKAADLQSRRPTEASRKERSARNGHPKAPVTSGSVNDVFDHQMELDQEQQNSTNGANKGQSDDGALDTLSDMAYSQLLDQAMDYGQILQREYRNEKGEYTKTLQNIFSLIAYGEPRDSVHGHLLDLNGRVKVAEELNSAILVSLGRSPTAALENAYKQTEALLDILGTDGGPASFVNLKASFEAH